MVRDYSMRKSLISLPRSMIQFVMLGLGVVAVLAQMACGTSTEDITSEVQGSCFKDDYCVDYIGSLYVDVQAVCDTTGRTFSDSACSTSGQVGQCLTGDGASNESVTHYMGTTHDAATLESVCESDLGGTYTAGE